ncbi:hypothetical protein [Orrella marina]|uniref:Formylmethanofuran dehydrogenase subunit E domain-containing protein n=1 Tax=Orrella marina TaxID=2163011 RepID=A0A2R4XMJ5_9BURK|nr:hypothetical protein [Orrella marina]AWB35018.1 hypothetical protein DBV39_16205 [Orrella marina]
MNEYSVTVCDQDGIITLTREDLLKYTGYGNVIAAALMIRVCKAAFDRLSPSEPVNRRELYWTLGFCGPGILDCVEMISLAIREGRCLQKPMLDHPQAPMSIGGQFVFDITYRNRSVRIWPDARIFDDEFREQVANWQDKPVSEERQAFLEYKHRKVSQILNEPESTLFTIEHGS